MVWYSHLFKNFPVCCDLHSQSLFVVIYTVKGFGIINKADVDVFLEFSCFFWNYFAQLHSFYMLTKNSPSQASTVHEP